MGDLNPGSVGSEELQEWLKLGLATQIADDPSSLKISQKQLARMQDVLVEMAEIYEKKKGMIITEEAIVSPPDWLLDATIKQTGLPEPVVMACIELIPYHIEELVE